LQISTHLFLVHDELIPNITPALDPRFRPSEVCLLVAPQMLDEAGRLRRLLRDSGIRVSEWALSDPWDIDHVRERVRAFVVGREDRDIALNATGGTRPMGLAAYEVFREIDRPVYYIHPESDQVVWLHPHAREPFDLADRIRLPAFLSAHDLRLVSVVKQGIAERLRNLTATLVSKADVLAGSLSILNWYASMTSNSGKFVSPPVTTAHLRDAKVAEMIQLFSSHGLLEVDARQRLVFKDEAARFYVNGGWLEEHVFAVIRQLRQELPTIQDVGRSLIVEWDDQGSPVKNEIDVAFLANNRLYLIECKTKRFDGGGSPEADAASTLYKLDTLRSHFGGDEARAMLVSYRTLGESIRMRADEIGIQLCFGQSLSQLSNHFKAWSSSSI